MTKIKSEENELSVIQAAAFKAYAPIAIALNECDEELRAEAIELFKQLAGGELDEHEVHATCALIAEILFPNADGKGFLGLDLDEAEEIAKSESPEAREVLAKMDAEEESFANRLAAMMISKGVTQEQLAEKIGVGQPAISMMLARQCRPQRKTVRRLAQALGVSPGELWPIE